MTTFDSAIDKLEFDKIRQRVARYALTEPGQDLIRSLPVVTSASVVRSLQAEVSECKRLLELEEGLPLEGVHSVRQALLKSGVEFAVLLPRDLLQIASTLRAARVVRAYTSRHETIAPLLRDVAEPLFADKVLEYNIDRAIDEGGTVRNGASRELAGIRAAITDRYDHLRKRLQSILRSVADQGFAQDEIITTREGRMVIPVKAEHKNHIPGFIHSASASGATVFIEPTETLELNNEIRNLQFQEQREVERILRELTAQVGEVRQHLLVNLEVLARLDAIQAKAKYSIEVLGIEPVIADEGPIRFTEARHPLLLMHHGRQGTVPVTLELGATFRTLVISGPNAGGKSVAMKCVGLLVLMAQAGLHIPAADDTRICVLQKMFVDIGDEQSIESDLSTFSSHLRNLQRIAEEADEHSLVLIDEIGSGTDPAEGGAIAASLLELLTRRGSLTVATTHHGALKVFAHETPGVENGAMEFDQKTLTPTYRFRTGIPGSSYALEMAERLGFSPEVMERARTMLGQQHMRLDALIGELESSAQEHRQALDDLRLQRARADELVRTYEARTAALGAELKEMKRKALAEAKDIVDRANAVIENTVRQIREQQASKGAVSATRQDVAALQTTIEREQTQLSESPGKQPEEQGVAPGDSVTLAGREDVGEVVDLTHDGSVATVVFGVVRMRVPVAELRRARPRRVDRTPSPETFLEKPLEATRDLDLRGMTGDEALPLVDKFIDTAILAGLHRVDIIHGKGTGALRKKVTEFLSRDPRVRSYRLGEWNEGGTGATVVEIQDQ